MYQSTHGSQLPTKIVSIIDIASDLGLKPSKKTFNKENYLPITFIKAKDLKVAIDIQRLVIVSMIKGAKGFDGKLARPLYVFKRPNGDQVITDGQHTAIIAILYTLEGREVEMACQVDVHPSHFSTQECEKAEAQKFRELNSKRRQAGKVDKLRADIAEGLTEALATLSDLDDMGVHVEKLGNIDGPEVKGFTLLMQAHSKYKLKNVRSAITKYQELQEDNTFPKWNDIGKRLDGGLIAGLSAVYHFLDEYLGGGDKAFALETYLLENLGRVSPSELKDGTPGVSQSTLIARKIILSCNAFVQQGYITKKNGEDLQVRISEEFLDKAGLSDPSKIK